MSYGIVCPACEGQLTTVLEARPDPDHVAGPCKWRVRECRDCGARIGTEERIVDVDQVRRRMSELAAERRQLRVIGAA